ncbi:hypothetical protein ABW19_dt0209044 [Dactylella cylindrospora]|nr:hypothetical protein ABW19_dt0209044 [Dactylella cylindrospora]
MKLFKSWPSMKPPERFYIRPFERRRNNANAATADCSRLLRLYTHIHAINHTVQYNKTGFGVHLWDVRTTDAREIWFKELANPPDIALFSHDAAFIASAATRNRFVKIWRRQAYALGEAEFDFSYLPHPHVVTSLLWKKPFHREIADENTLYTFAADGVFRVWSPMEPHEVYPFQLCASLDLRTPTVQPALNGTTKWNQAAEFELEAVISVINTRVFTLATEQAVLQVEKDIASKQQLQSLVDVAKRSSEVLLMFHSSGYMSAWGIENAGSKSRRTLRRFAGPNIEYLSPQTKDYVVRSLGAN